jgi:carbamoyltransferase
MNILGISAFYHDSAAALVIDGRIAAAAQEERWTRIKHDQDFPTNAIRFCLENSGLTGADLDYITFYDKPFVKFERLLETYLTFAPFGLKSWLKAMPQWLKKKLWIKELLAKELTGFEGQVLFTNHHQAHAASAFFPSPYKEAAFLTMDGVGEWTTTSFGVGEGNGINILQEVRFPHSLGLLYSAFTYYTGFRVNSGEYKVMGLAPYGRPRYKDLILEHLIDVKEDGSFRMDMDYFDYCAGLTMTNKRFEKLFGGPPRRPESEVTQRDMDLARSVQEVTEMIMMRAAQHVHEVTGKKHLCLAGGVALNCVGNGRILRESPYEDIWIQPAAGDAGGALGAALYTWYVYLNHPRAADGTADSQFGSFLGPAFDNGEILAFLEKQGLPYRELTDQELPGVVADLIADQKVIGWFQGRMEFGPRALGARSILGDARNPETQSVINLKIKYRESFRPFAPSVLGEACPQFFHLDKPSPYMLLVAPVHTDICRQMTDEECNLFGLDMLHVKRSDIPAVTHVDYSARIQTVHAETNPLYHRLLETFREKTGCPVIVNTSFNVRGEPIVCTPEHAYLCFMRTEMDYLVMGNYLLSKTEQPPLREDVDWRQLFALD